MADSLSILIVGASIAGPATAYWLTRAGLGASITIIEQYPEFRKGGQNINIRSTAVQVMRRAPGMEAAVNARRVPLDGFAMVNDRVEPLGTVNMSSNPEKQSLLSQFEIFRDDLSGILTDLTLNHPEITYIYNEQVAQMTYSGDSSAPVKVDFLNGHPSAFFDLVIACDGATSRTRAMGLACGLRGNIGPLNVWVAYLSIDEDLLKGTSTGISQGAVRGRNVTLVPDVVGKKVRSALICAYPTSDSTSIAAFHKANQSIESLKALVQETFEDMGGNLPRILEHMQAAPDFYAGEVVQVKAPMLHKDRFVMVGDAGYAPGFAGTGTILALTGAYVLAGELKRAHGDLLAGLRGYEERMRPIITKMQKLPPGGMSIFAPQTSWGLWFRNIIYMIATRSGLVGFLQNKLFSQSAGVDEFNLEDYNFV